MGIGFAKHTVYKYCYVLNYAEAEDDSEEEEEEEESESEEPETDELKHKHTTDINILLHLNDASMMFQGVKSIIGSVHDSNKKGRNSNLGDEMRKDTVTTNSNHCYELKLPVYSMKNSISSADLAHKKELQDLEAQGLAILDEIQQDKNKEMLEQEIAELRILDEAECKTQEEDKFDDVRVSKNDKKALKNANMKNNDDTHLQDVVDYAWDVDNYDKDKSLNGKTLN